MILGSALNNDGRSNGLTAPNPAAQKRVLIEAWRRAGIAADTIGYLEAHGTGTALGDPIEIEALSAAFGEFTSRRQFCRLGSVKTNLGHCEAAAGMAGLIKVLLCLKHRQLPPSLHFEVPNRHIAFEESPFYVVDRLTPWQVPPGQKRRAGISSFGFGGTNAHVVVEEPPPLEAVVNPVERPAHLLLLSARTREGLVELARRYQTHLGQTDQQLADICYTAATGRMHLAQRLAVVADDLSAAQAQLTEFLAEPERSAARCRGRSITSSGPSWPCSSPGRPPNTREWRPNCIAPSPRLAGRSIRRPTGCGRSWTFRWWNCLRTQSPQD